MEFESRSVGPDGVQRLRAEDGIRTRDPHLGKVMLYQLSHVRVAVRTLHGLRRRPRPGVLTAGRGSAQRAEAAPPLERSAASWSSRSSWSDSVPGATIASV